MSDTAFVLIMAAIIVFPIALTAWVRRRDALEDAAYYRNFVNRRRCFTMGCSCEPRRSELFCEQCAQEMKGARKS